MNLKYLAFSLIFVSGLLVNCTSGKVSGSKKSVAKTENFVPPDSLPIGLSVGQVAPDLEFKNPQDSVIKLSSLRGYYVLVDFWASWCGPCRYENPNVVKAYAIYKDAQFNKGKGFRIYNVSLDNARDPWVKAIEKDGLGWPYHVSDLKGWYSEAARIYSVNSIPANWLVDPYGVIVAKGLRGPALDAKLASLVKSETK